MNVAALLEQFCGAVERRDGKAFAALFAEDGVYHDVFYGDFKGRERIAEMIDERLDRRLGTVEKPTAQLDVFDVRDAIERLNDPQTIMQEWFTFEGREYPSDYGVVFFRGWTAFTIDQKHAAIVDAKRAIDRSLSVS